MNYYRKHEHHDPERVNEIFQHIRDYPEDEQSRRVEEIIELLSRLGGKSSKIEKMQIVTRLDRLLSAYTWVIRIAPGMDGFRVFHAVPKGERDHWEREAIRDLLAVVPFLDEQRIRRCAECGKWLFAANLKRKWCDGNCRQHNYDSDPKRRRDKSRYMREVYRPLRRRHHGLK